jgi:hypothetical protein
MSSTVLTDSRDAFVQIGGKESNAADADASGFGASNTGILIPPR